jgi:hypothetical protein
VMRLAAFGAAEGAAIALNDADIPVEQAESRLAKLAGTLRK